MFRSKAICLAASVMIALTPATTCFAADPQLNFKIYSPQDPPAAEPAAPATEAAPAEADSTASSSTETNSASTSSASTNASAATSKEEPSSIFEDEPAKMQAETPKPANVEPTVEKVSPAAETSTEPTASPAAAVESVEKPVDSAAVSTTSEERVEVSKDEAKDGKETKTLQGYVRVVPTGTKIPIVMDTAVDSDTSQEGDEFSARTSEDLTIDGSTIVPAGSVIKGRIATLNAPRAMSRSGSVALKFDTITTPDNRQIPLVANLVARGGVVHARRGMKDVAIDAGTVAGPLAAGLLIGLLAGHSSSSTTTTTTSSSSSSKMSKGTAAAIGAGIGLAVGIAVLLAKKGKKVEVRPGDELKIELAEELRMPTM